MEIYTDQDGEVILKKYSPMVELLGFAGQYAEALAQNSGHVVCITDREQVIAAAGGHRKELLRQEVSTDLGEIMERREIYQAGKGSDRSIPVTMQDAGQYAGEVVAPILCQGDVIGSVVLLNREERRTMGEMERKLAATAAGFLGKQMES